MDDPLFERFWENYPRRVGKGAARKAWKRLNPSPELIAQMVQTLSWQRQTEQWRKDNGQFIPHARTWLAQERWMDEPMMTQVEQWICPHVPTCRGRWACQNLQQIAAYKEQHR